MKGVICVPLTLYNPFALISDMFSCLFLRGISYNVTIFAANFMSGEHISLYVFPLLIPSLKET